MGSAAPCEGHIQRDEPRLPLLPARSARPTVANVPLAD